MNYAFASPFAAALFVFAANVALQQLNQLAAANSVQHMFNSNSIFDSCVAISYNDVPDVLPLIMRQDQSVSSLDLLGDVCFRWDLNQSRRMCLQHALKLHVLLLHLLLHLNEIRPVLQKLLHQGHLIARAFCMDYYFRNG